MNLGRVFKYERTRLGVTQKEMAEKLGLTTSALWKIEANRNYPKPKTIEALCRIAFIPIARFYQEAMTLDDYKFPATSITDGVSTVSFCKKK